MQLYGSALIISLLLLGCKASSENLYNYNSFTSSINSPSYGLSSSNFLNDKYSTFSMPSSSSSFKPSFSGLSDSNLFNDKYSTFSMPSSSSSFKSSFSGLSDSNLFNDKYSTFSMPSSSSSFKPSFSGLSNSNLFTDKYNTFSSFSMPSSSFAPSAYDLSYKTPPALPEMDLSELYSYSSPLNEVDLLKKLKTPINTKRIGDIIRFNRKHNDDIKKPLSLKSLLNSKIKSATMYERPLDSKILQSIAPLPALFINDEALPLVYDESDEEQLKHVGMLVKLASGKKYLVHKGKSGKTVVVNAKHMSPKWTAIEKIPTLGKHTVSDYIRAGGSEYSWHSDNCGNAVINMRKLEQK